MTWLLLFHTFNEWDKQAGGKFCGIGVVLMVVAYNSIYRLSVF